MTLATAGAHRADCSMPRSRHGGSSKTNPIFPVPEPERVHVRAGGAPLLFGLNETRPEVVTEASGGAVRPTGLTCKTRQISEANHALAAQNGDGQFGR